MSNDKLLDSLKSLSSYLVDIAHDVADKLDSDESTLESINEFGDDLRSFLDNEGLESYVADVKRDKYGKLKEGVASIYEIGALLLLSGGLAKTAVGKTLVFESLYASGVTAKTSQRNLARFPGNKEYLEGDIPGLVNLVSNTSGFELSPEVKNVLDYFLNIDPNSPAQVRMLKSLINGLALEGLFNIGVKSTSALAKSLKSKVSGAVDNVVEQKKIVKEIANGGKKPPPQVDTIDADNPIKNSPSLQEAQIANTKTLNSGAHLSFEKMSRNNLNFKDFNRLDAIVTNATKNDKFLDSYVSKYGGTKLSEKIRNFYKEYPEARKGGRLGVDLANRKRGLVVTVIEDSINQEMITLSKFVREKKLNKVQAQKWLDVFYHLEEQADRVNLYRVKGDRLVGQSLEDIKARYRLNDASSLQGTPSEIIAQKQTMSQMNEVYKSRLRVNEIDGVLAESDPEKLALLLADNIENGTDTITSLSYKLRNAPKETVLSMDSFYSFMKSGYLSPASASTDFVSSAFHGVTSWMDGLIKSGSLASKNTGFSYMKLGRALIDSLFDSFTLREIPAGVQKFSRTQVKPGGVLSFLKNFGFTLHNIAERFGYRLGERVNFYTRAHEEIARQSEAWKIAKGLSGTSRNIKKFQKNLDLQLKEMMATPRNYRMQDKRVERVFTEAQGQKIIDGVHDKAAEDFLKFPSQKKFWSYRNKGRSWKFLCRHR